MTPVIIGNATLHLGDCMEYMATLDDKAFDLAIVDPPYGIGSFHDHATKGKPSSREWKIDWNDSIPDACYFAELYRVSKNVIVWGVNYYGGHVREVGRIFWDKVNSSNIGSDGEIASQFKDKRVVKLTLQNIGFIGPEKGQKIHPCQKPVALYEWLLTNYAKPGQTILDTHLGGGSSAIAANNLGFDFVGCELDADYFSAACQRIENEQRQTTLFAPAPVKQEQIGLSI